MKKKAVDDLLWKLQMFADGGDDNTDADDNTDDDTKIGTVYR